VVIFGADLGQQCLDQGELDEVLVHVAPVFIGAGTPLTAARVLRWSSSTFSRAPHRAS
jgi:dihydrofolate reductase